MTDKLKNFITNRYLPQWVIFCADAFIILSSFLLAYALRFNFVMSGIDNVSQNVHALMASSVYILVSLVFKPYSGIIRHATTHDIIRITKTVLCSAALLACYTTIAIRIDLGRALVLPYSVIITHMMVTGSLLTFTRLAIKYGYSVFSRNRESIVPIMIYGAGDLGQTTFLALEKSKVPVYDIIGFIDSNHMLQGKKKSGQTIYSPESAMKKIIPEKNVREIIIAVQQDRINKNENNVLINYCLDKKVTVKKVPPLNAWINGTFSPQQANRIDILDLLGRKEIHLDTFSIQQGLEGKTILVTGAAGSIGSEIVRQLTNFRSGKIILLDQAESGLYDLQTELRLKRTSCNFDLVIADVSNKQRMEYVFRRFRPEIVFNAAAYKHVPLLEDNVCEAVRVNIGGTKILADLSMSYGVKKFVMISTDKAVNPTNVMGSTKRICELYVQSLAGSGCGTQFITTRFGNVLGSNGSVVPLFTKQIERGGPVTITHFGISRYFMTIPEACQLVLEAGFMGKGGEIFVFDMGEPVMIYDLAKKMISLAGFEPEKDIKIIETGLRPGEKLFEEVLASKEKNLSTHHPKIMIANMRKTDTDKVKSQISDLISALSFESDIQLVERIKNLVPEFTPQNQKFKQSLFKIIENELDNSPLSNLAVNRRKQA